MFSQNNYDVGLYCRLSREDDNGNNESMSISNQRDFLIDYVNREGWNLKRVYIDDGFSGTNFDRPDFRTMISDAKAGKINCIVTRDLSRLGRNYVETGRYTDNIFPELGIRFIAVNDNIDTCHDNNDFAPFHHVINEFYPKQISKKVRQVKRNGAEQGKFMGSHAPYGFQKSPQDKHKLIIDEYAASIVERVYREFCSGSSARGIAEQLNKDSVNSPRFHSATIPQGQKPKAGENNNWSSATILKILRNAVYAGDMVQGKRQVVSFKTKKRRSVDPSDWIIVKDTHEAIIPRDIWDDVQNRISTGKHHVRKSNNRNIEPYSLFSGCLICADCGAKLAFQSKPINGAYRCSRYNNAGKTACSSHFILEETLSELVLNDIRQYAVLSNADRVALESRLIQSMQNEQDIELKELEKQKHKIENRKNEISGTIKSLYEDKTKGILTDTLFKSLACDYEQEQSDLEEQYEFVCQSLAVQMDAQNMASRFTDCVHKLLDIEKLSREIVMELVYTITIGEAKIESGKRTQLIEIQYRFIGNALTKANEDIPHVIR